MHGPDGMLSGERKPPIDGLVRLESRYSISFKCTFRWLITTAGWQGAYLSLFTLPVLDKIPAFSLKAPLGR